MALDLLSTSQKIQRELVEGGASENMAKELAEEVELSWFYQAEKCEFGAPFICWKDDKHRWNIGQGSCNHWECPRCGQIRARREFARMVIGALELTSGGERLFFITITCRGREMPLRQAEENYLRWSNRLLTASRANARKTNQEWAYACVTERQKRGHPHSHLISTWCPHDAEGVEEDTELENGARAGKNCLYSRWFVERNHSAGLGVQCNISEIQNPIGAASYLAKYFFKLALHEVWPQGWRRVRYSRNWPKLEEHDDCEAFPVVTLRDWQKVARLPGKVYAQSVIELKAAYARLVTNVVPLLPKDNV